jgi:hypothetical protein
LTQWIIQYRKLSVTRTGNILKSSCPSLRSSCPNVQGRNWEVTLA